MSTAPDTDAGIRAELAAMALALGAELRRRKRWGASRTAAGEDAQGAPAAHGTLTPAAPPGGQRSAQEPPGGASRGPETEPGIASHGIEKPVSSPKPAPLSAPRGVPKPLARPAILREESPLSTGPTDLAGLRSLVATCIECALSAGPRASGALPGRGAARPRLLIVTDYAGPAERAYGKVLGPEAGELIKNLAVQGFGIGIQEVHVTAAVKCPLPQGCRPSPSEAKTCSRWLEAEIELLQPETIIGFGELVARVVSDSADGLESARGRLLSYKGIPTVVTVPPRDMLADPDLKKGAWSDMKLLLPHFGG